MAFALPQHVSSTDVTHAARCRERFYLKSHIATPKYKERIMAVVALATPVLMAAAGYSLIYLLLGGGLGGAILIFIVAKMLGR
jgi:hypothetical protein